MLVRVDRGTLAHLRLRASCWSCLRWSWYASGIGWKCWRSWLVLEVAGCDCVVGKWIMRDEKDGCAWRS